MDQLTWFIKLNNSSGQTEFALFEEGFPRRHQKGKPLSLGRRFGKTQKVERGLRLCLADNLWPIINGLS